MDTIAPKIMSKHYDANIKGKVASNSYIPSEIILLIQKHCTIMANYMDKKLSKSQK